MISDTLTSFPGVLPPPGYQPTSDTLLAVRAARADSDEEDRDTAGRVRNIGSIRQGGARGRREADYDDDEYA